MSNFKRRQSQVFWKIMENQDLGLPPATNVFQTLDYSPKNQSVENVDARDVPFLSPPIGERDPCESEDQPDAAVYKNEGDPWVNPDYHPRERSASPRSLHAGHRSQDSGFSDSERSEESGVDAYASRVERLRRARTRKSRRKKETEEPEQFHSAEQLSSPKNTRRLESLWNTSEILPDPRHTSTPKPSHPRGRRLSASQPRAPRRRGRDFPAGNDEPETCTGAYKRGVNIDDNEENDEEDRVPRLIGLPMEDEECLGDFLYASEPPEDVFKVEVHQVRSAVTRESRTRFNRNPENLHGQLSAVRSWLGFLALETEAECGSTLQSKALPRTSRASHCSNNGNKIRDFNTPKLTQATDSTLLTASATTAATKLLARVDQFQKKYQSAIDELNKSASSRSERSLVQSIEEEAFLLLSELGSPPPQRVRNLSSSREILRQLRGLQREVNHVVDARLDFYVERIVRGLEEAPREEGTAARGALAALTVLGLGPGGTIGGRSIARCLGVRALLTALLSIRGNSAGSRDSRAACLRALASVCCCAEAIDQLIVNGGPELLVDLLSAESAPEVEKMEATALIVQITAPWTNAIGLPHLEPFADYLVPSLTHIVDSTTCSQTLLLAAAALNNLGNSPQCVGPMVARKTIAVLLRSVKRSGGGSIWLMEQVASLIGELARSEELHPHLAEARASVALVCFLRMRPPGLESAYRRLEATASAALARLCVHREVAQQVVDVGGVNCVIPYPNSAQQTVENNVNTRYTRSLRIACKKAAEQIHAAKTSDRVSRTLDL